MNNEIALTELQVDQIKEYADKERKKFGVIDVPIAGELFMLLELLFANTHFRPAKNLIQMLI